MKRTVVLLLLAFFLFCGFGGCALSSPNTNESKIKMDWSKITKIVIIEDREAQISWELTSKHDVATICELFQNMKYGEERAGGSAGSFLRLQFFAGDARLGEIILESPDIMQYADGNSMIVLPIVEGAWSASQWHVFLDQLSK